MGLQRRAGVGVQHNILSGRSGVDCHPVSAITGLEERLTNIETMNDDQQTDIDSLVVDSNIDGGNFGDTPGLTYDGGEF